MSRSLLPLTLFGFISLKAIDVFGNTEGSLMIFNIYMLNFNFTTAFQLLMVLTGLLITGYLIYKIIQYKITKDRQSLVFVIQGIVPLIFSVIYITLFFTWANHGDCLCISFRTLERKVLSCVMQTAYVFMNSLLIRFFYGNFTANNVAYALIFT